MRWRIEFHVHGSNRRSNCSGRAVLGTRWRHHPCARRRGDQALRRVRGARQRLPRRGARQARLLPRPVGLRQDHPAAGDRRAGDAGCGTHRDRRPRRNPAAALAARFRHRVPVLRAVSQPDRCAERRLRPRQPPQAAQGDQGPRGRAADAGRSPRADQQISSSVVGRTAAARGLGPGVGILALAAAAGRAAVCPGCPGARAPAR